MGCCASTNAPAKPGKAGTDSSKAPARKGAPPTTAKQPDSPGNGKEGKPGQAAAGMHDEPGNSPASDPTARSRPASAPRSSAFVKKNLTAIKDQQELHTYFLDAVLFNEVAEVENVLAHDWQAGRATVQAASYAISAGQGLPTPHIMDVSAITLRNAERSAHADQPLVLKTRYGEKRFSRGTDLWNPVLLMIAKHQTRPLERLLMTRTTSYLHLPGLFSKPYHDGDQLNKQFT